jgi:DNA polymerase-3 subunit alpha
VGRFRSLFDFCARVDRKRVNKRAVEALIKAGAFDSLQPTAPRWWPASTWPSISPNAAGGQRHQGGLFDLGGDDDHGSSTQEPELVEAEPWGIKERLTLEKTAIGFYLSGHLFDAECDEVRRFASAASPI